MTAIALVKRVWPYLAGAAILMGTLYAAYRHGVSVEGNRLNAIHAEDMRKRDAATADVLRDVLEASRKNLEASQRIERAALEQQQAGRSLAKTLMESVDRYVQENPVVLGCGLDGDGLRIWRDANAGPGRSGGAHAGGAGISDDSVR